MSRLFTAHIGLALLLVAFFICAKPAASYAACSGPAGNAAAIIYNSSGKVFQYCNGTDWLKMNSTPGTGSGGCAAAPAVPEGTMIYNTDQRVMQGCAGNVHKAFGPIGGRNGWKQVSVGQLHTCGIRGDDTLWCWGSNSSGQLGDNSTTDRLVPTAISGGGSWKQVSAGSSHTCGILSDDSVRCWGNNGNGQLGDNSTTQRLVPTAISGGGSWKQVSAGNNHTCGILSNDTLHCWGSNSTGQLGDNSTTQRLVPTAISGGGSWKQVSAGNTHTCGILSDDSVRCWGSNGNGQLTATEFSSPYRMTGVQTLCSNPVGKAGAMVFNSTANLMQYCDGVDWVRMGR